MTSSPILWVHVGDPHHGVQRFGRILASARPAGPSTRQVRLPDLDDPDALRRLDAARGAQQSDAVILQFTDRQWGADPEQALVRFEAVAETAGSARLVVGLHDLPRPDELRRRAAYATVARRCDVVIVCSDHERRRLDDLVTVHAAVVPHPVERRRAQVATQHPRTAEVAVLGFVYPGKGHEDVIVAVARSLSRPSVLVLGGAAPGHEDLMSELSENAAQLGVRLRATGWVPDDVLVAGAEQAAIPVVPNCAPSASGSLASWLAAGRRPLVRDSEYAREVSDLVPGGLDIYAGDDPEALAAKLDVAAARPESTLGPGVPDALRPERIARRWAQLAEEAS